MGRKAKDLIGMKFGRLTVIERAEVKNKNSYWKCLCGCGKEIIVRGDCLKNGSTQSCGCLSKRNKHKDLINKKFGKLTVVELNGKDKWNAFLWKCTCECGNETIVRSSSLLDGNTQSCGCSANKFIDITGQKFGRLNVIELNKKTKNNQFLWFCKCDCRNECIVSGNNLKNGHTKSCGCLARELSSQRMFKDLAGQKFGRLLAIKPNGKKYGFYLWECLCDCGNITTVLSHSLLNGNTQSCGCLAKELNFKNLTGMIFERLTVIEVCDKDSNGNYQWLCRCECGNTKIIPSRDLIGGYTLSCGCLGVERRREATFNDLTGKIFGKLVAVKPANKDISGRYKWLCTCECGNEVIVSGASLLIGATKSCGCLDQSMSCYEIEKFFKEYNINYKKEYRFDDCRNIYPLPFDFAIFDCNGNLLCLTEVDGKQHFEPIQYFGGEEEFKQRKINDQIKNDYCKSNNIILYRIPYWEEKNIIPIIDSIVNNKNNIHLNFAVQI